MRKYIRYSLALTTLEQTQLDKAKQQGYGVKKIFKSMLDALCPVTDEEKKEYKNKSAIIRNFPDDKRNEIKITEEEI